MSRFVVLVIFPFLLFGVMDRDPRRELQDDLDRKENLTVEEELFLQADEIFDPLYAGPLITGGASNMGAGEISITPFTILFVQNYSLWDANRKSINIKDRYTLNPQGSILVGVTDWLDLTVILQGFTNWEGSRSSGGFGDMTVGIGIPILLEGLYQPALRFVFNETFPTGRYQKLNPNLDGLDATGLGSYQNQLGLRLSKIIFWSTKHPMNLRWAYSLNIPTNVHVKGFNSYGGGEGTNGTIKPGISQQTNIAVELSLTHQWVFACDFVYDWSNRTRFKGFPGFGATSFDNGEDPTDSIRFDGVPPVVGVGSNDQFSIAPAIEYNPSVHLSFVGGIWFNVYGRNVPKFIAGGTTLSYTF